MADEATTTDTTTTTTEATTEATQAAAQGDGVTRAETTTEVADDEATVLASAGTEKAEEGDGGEGEGGEASGEEAEGYQIALKDENGEDIALDAEMLEAATPVLKELGIDNEGANKLAPLAHQIVTKTQEGVLTQMADAGKAQAKEWLEELRADEELGKGNYDNTIHLAAKGLDALGFTAEHPFRELLNQSGLGNHPDMVRTFHTLGKLAGEEGLFPTPEGAGEQKQAGWADLYKD